jgi:hypothetical protein
VSPTSLCLHLYSNLVYGHVGPPLMIVPILVQLAMLH